MTIRLAIISATCLADAHLLNIAKLVGNFLGKLIARLMMIQMRRAQLRANAYLRSFDDAQLARFGLEQAEIRKLRHSKPGVSPIL